MSGGGIRAVPYNNVRRRKEEYHTKIYSRGNRNTVQ